MLEIKAANESDPATADRCYSKGDKPIRPKIQVYPINNIKEKRRFRSCWYSKYEWLEYSVSKDAAYCFACRKFTKEVGLSCTKYVTIGKYFLFI